MINAKTNAWISELDFTLDYIAQPWEHIKTRTRAKIKVLTSLAKDVALLYIYDDKQKDFTLYEIIDAFAMTEDYKIKVYCSNGQHILHPVFANNDYED